MIAVQNVGVAFGARVLFRDLSFVLQARDRVALVGPNGAGKSTLMKMLAGLITPDSGAIVRAKGVRTGYLAQEGVAAKGRSLVEEVESAFAGVQELRGRMDELDAAMDSLETGSPEYLETLDRMGELQLRLDAAGVDRIRPMVETVLSGLGFDRSGFGRPVESFSGGWQMRVAMARILVSSPDLLLLDEPTNHLDLDSLRWIERYLAGFGGALVLISHDRSFLDALVRRTLAFAHGRVEEYTGNYSDYESQSVARREQLEKAAAAQGREIARTQAFIDRFRAKATKASQVQSRIKMLDRIDRIELDDDGPEVRFRFPPAPPAGQVVMKMEKVTRRYGSLTVFENLDFAIEKGDRLAIVGVNGAGKSTFSRLISLREKPSSGSVTPGYKVRVAHFAQDQAEELDPGLTVLQTLEAVDTGGTAVDRRAVLGCFLFRGDDVFKSVSVLSGGEKSRLALARMLLEPANFLVLDEPTNHLDMASQGRLQRALKEYDGSFAIVSHNRSFLDPLVNKVLAFAPGRPPRLHLGNLSDYIAKVEAEERALGGVDDKTPNGGKAAAGRREQRRQEARLREERARVLKPLEQAVEEIEKRVVDLETRKAALAAQLMDPPEDADMRQLPLDYRTTEQALEKAYSEWEEAADAVARAEARFAGEMAN